jgi:hypothetical protein
VLVVSRFINQFRVLENYIEDEGMQWTYGVPAN